MLNRLNTALGATVLRVGLGLVLLAHSLYLKLVVFTLAGTAEFFVSLGLPGVFAYLVFLAESVAGLALLLGVYVRTSALCMIPVLLGATWAHGANGWLFTNAGGGWEYPLFLAWAAAAQVLLGEGRFALSHRWASDAAREVAHG